MVRQTVNSAAVSSPRVIEPAQAYLVCSLHGGLYGFEVNRVRHMGTVGRIWSLPLVPKYVKGITRIQGRLVPLVDLRLKLGLPMGAYHDRTCFVLTDTAAPVAVTVDSVEGLRSFDERQFVSAAEFSMGSGSRAVNGIIPFKSRFCFLLDLDWILFGRSSRACDEQVACAGPPNSVKSQTCEASSDAAAVSFSDTHVARSLNFKALTAANRDATDGAPFPVDQAIHALLRFDMGLSHGSACELALLKASHRARVERVTRLLAKPVLVGKRRMPGFRPGDPRRSALATALLEMPSTFQTKQAALAVAALLGRSSEDYRITHFRYDFAKLRARHLAERIGTSHHYRLTKIGRIVCETLKNDSAVAILARPRVAIPPRARATALSA